MMDDTDTNKQTFAKEEGINNEIERTSVVDIDSRRERILKISDTYERMFAVNSYATVNDGNRVRGSTYIGDIVSVLAERQISNRKNK